MHQAKKHELVRYVRPHGGDFVGDFVGHVVGIFVDDFVGDFVDQVC